MSGWCSDTYLCSLAAPSAPFRIINAFREEYLCSLKKVLFLSICRLFHLVFPQDVHGKNVGRIFLDAFLGYPYCWKGTKMSLDAALLNTAKYLNSNHHVLFSSYISVKNHICGHQFWISGYLYWGASHIGCPPFFQKQFVLDTALTSLTSNMLISCLPLKLK